MTQILFIDFLGVYHHHLALEMNQTHNNGWVQQKQHLRSLILCCTDLIYP